MNCKVMTGQLLRRPSPTKKQSSVYLSLT